MRLPAILLKIINSLRLTVLRASGVDIGSGVMTYGHPHFHMHRGSTIQIGDRVVICSDSKYTALALNHPVKISTVAEGASVSIGRDTGISGAAIVCAKKIQIGVEVLLGANVLIVDTDFHPVHPEGRRHSDDASKIHVMPIEIGNNVFVGTGAIILKGAKIGKDSVVAAGAVVRGVFEDGVIIAGNPAKVVGSVYQDSIR